jgi:hypothetical protein
VKTDNANSSSLKLFFNGLNPHLSSNFVLGFVFFLMNFEEKDNAKKRR